MSKFPPLLLKKWAMTGSLSQNLFCQYQAKDEWLTILELLKRNKKQGKRPQPLTKTIDQTNKVLLKGYIYIYTHTHIYLWCPFGALALNFSRWLMLLDNTCLLHLYLYLFWWGYCLGVTLVFVSIPMFSIVPTYSITSGYVHKFCMMFLHVQFLEDMCTNFVFWLCLTDVWFVPAYSILVGYVHKWPWCSNPQGSLGWRIHCGWWKTQ